MRVIANNFRGFRRLDFRTEGTTFLVGDNSSGKSSILHLVNLVASANLDGTPTFNEELGLSRFDFFSPLLDRNDVSIGFTSEDEKKAYKFVTLRYQKRASPRTIRVTYANSELCFSLKHVRGDSYHARLYLFSEPTDLESVERVHHRNSGWKRVKIDEVPVDIKDPGFAIYALHQLQGAGTEFNKLFSAILSPKTPIAHFMGPLRTAPEPFYRSTKKMRHSGSHFAAMGSDGSSNERFGQRIRKFGRASGLFDDMYFRQASPKMDDSPLYVVVKRHGHEFLLNQVGIGISQVAPIIVESSFSAMDDFGPEVLLLQQPELHLHPIAQAALGEFFFDISQNKNVSQILETHSDFLIDRFRAKIRDSKSNRRNSRILYCSTDKNGNSVHEILINGDGKLENVPNKYRNFFLKEFARTLF